RASWPTAHCGKDASPLPEGAFAGRTPTLHFFALPTGGCLYGWRSTAYTHKPCEGAYTAVREDPERCVTPAHTRSNA
ncbi:MAG: hypothetical protein ACREU8_07560, partial [Gammaproteobacteria bacterium]